ncbi:MAG: tRNA lysidine(34) synthetase TilS [Bacteroidales bacterium]|jgi:tRNA(Ile)-lysidine synthase|nr:tRNA lysidine(34) synthetase TilS [Bacteroidales bacterium]
MRRKFDENLRKLLAGVGSARIIAAVSGGIDSMCMLDLLYNSTLHIDLAIAHMNFNLRGKESDSDESLVSEWAAGHGVKFFRKSVETIAYAKSHSVSIEMAARDLRYSWFSELSDKYGYEYIAVAHNANDNAETLFLNLSRGTGLRGICGMKEFDGKILRPMLVFTRKEIDNYNSNNGLTVHLDRTNLDSDIARNRIRIKILPELLRINPSLIKTLNRDMSFFRDAMELAEESVLEKEVVASKRIIGSNPYLKKILDNEVLLSMKGSRSVLFHILSSYGFNSSSICDIYDELSSREVKRYDGEGYSAIRERGMLKIYSSDVFDIPDNVYLKKTDIPAVLNFGWRSFSFSFSDQRPSSFHDILALSADKLSFPLELRVWKKGERFIPFGMKGSKKVSDYLTDIKIPNAERSTIPVLISRGGITCIPGYQVSDSFKIDGSSNEFLIIRKLR